MTDNRASRERAAHHTRATQARCIPCRCVCEICRWTATDTVCVCWSSLHTTHVPHRHDAYHAAACARSTDGQPRTRSVCAGARCIPHTYHTGTMHTMPLRVRDLQMDSHGHG